jgi:hypothetical protein
MPCGPSKVPGRAHRVPARCPGLHYRNLAAHPGTGVLDRLPRSGIFRSGGLEEMQNVFRARRRPQREEVVIRVGEGSTTADRHEARVANLRKDHD